MAKVTTITGVNKVINNLRIANASMALKIGGNLKSAGLFVQRESQKIVPVDTTNLKGTAKTQNVGGDGLGTDIVVHYGDEADYAVYVHENLDAKHKPGKRAKFLESVIRERKDEIIKIISKG